ncbi:MAG: hypothetical protein AB4041_14270 [Microcystaceae cyanobacterium]
MSQTLIWTKTFSGFDLDYTQMSDQAEFVTNVFDAVGSISSISFEGENIEFCGAGVRITGVTGNVVEFECEMKLKSPTWAEGSVGITIIALAE